MSVMGAMGDRPLDRGGRRPGRAPRARGTCRAGLAPGLCALLLLVAPPLRAQTSTYVPPPAPAYGSPTYVPPPAPAYGRPGYAAGPAYGGGFWLPQGQKPTRLMLNFKVGPALGAYQYYYGTGGAPTQLAFEAEVGIPITYDGNGYLILPFQFQVASSVSTVMLPVGFHYDIRLPVPGLYLTPRLSVGYALWVSGTYAYNPGIFGLYHTGFVLPEFGLKYVVRGRLNLGAELFSLPIFFGADGLMVQYRMLGYVGFNF